MSHVICIKFKGEEESTDKRGLSCINLKVNNNNKSHNQITRRRSFSCIGLSKGIRKMKKIIFVFQLFFCFFLSRFRKKKVFTNMLYIVRASLNNNFDGNFIEITNNNNSCI